MKEYIITLIGTVLICSLATMLAPEDEKGMSGYVKLAASLCILCVAISPLSSFITKIANIGSGTPFFESGEVDKERFKEIYEKNLKDASAVNISETLKAMLCRNFGFETDKIDVYVELCEDGEVYLPESVSIVLWRGEGTLMTDPHKVIDYVGEMLGCRCEIVYG